MYGSFAVDPERQIRESCQELILAVVKRDKKWLSSTIKELFYPWIGSLNDSVAVVAAVATRAFDLCFGRGRYADVCKIAHKYVVNECLDTLIRDNGNQRDEESRAERTQELNHALKALQFILEHSEPDVLEGIRNMESFRGIIGCDNFKSLLAQFPDPMIRSTFYSLLSTLLGGEPIVEQAEVCKYVRFAAADLVTCAAPSAIVLLATAWPRYGGLEVILATLEKALPTDMPKESIKQVSLIVEGIPDELEQDRVLDSIYRVISDFKGFDSTRLAAIWSLYISCSDVYGMHHFQRAARNFFSVPSASRGIRAEVLKLFRDRHGSVLKEELEKYVMSDVDPAVKMELLLILPDEVVSAQAASSLTNSFSLLLPDKRRLLFDRVISSSVTSSLTTEYVRLYVATVFGEQHLERVEALAERIFKKSPTTDSPLDIAQNEFFRNLPSVSPAFQLHLLRDIVSDGKGRTFPITDQVALLALEHFEDHIDVLARYVFAKGDAIWLCANPRAMELLKRLQPQVCAAIQSSDPAFCNAIVGTIAVLCGGDITLDQGKRLLEKLFKYVEHRELVCAAVECILSKDPHQWSNLLNLVTSANASLPSRIRTHLNSTVAVYSLCDFSDTNEANRGCWEAQDEHGLSIYLLQIAFTWALRDGTLGAEGDALTLLLEMAAFTACLEEEENYRLDSRNFDHAPGGALLRALKEYFDDKAGNEDPLATQLHRLVQEGTDPFCLLARRIGFPIKSNSSAKPFADMKAFIHHNDSTLARLRNHVKSSVYLGWILGSADGPEGGKPLVGSCVDDIWTIFCRMAIDDPPVPALKGLAEALGRVILRIHDELGFVTGDQILQVLLSAGFDAIKVACRSLLVRRLDVVLEAARVRLDQCDDIPRLLIPWPSLCDHLCGEHGEQHHCQHDCQHQCQHDRQHQCQHDCQHHCQRDCQHHCHQHRYQEINTLFMLDLFLCLAEGAREDMALSSQYAAIFKDHIGNAFLPRLCIQLGWFGEEKSAIVDLSRVEFTVLRWEEEERVDRVQFCANLLFRCLKSFPAYLRGWYEGLRRDEAIGFQRYIIIAGPLFISSTARQELHGLYDPALHPARAQKGSSRRR